MKDERIDLSGLAAASNAERWSTLLRDTVARSGEIVDTYQLSATPLDYLLLWTRPALVAATIVIATSLAVLGRELTTVKVQHGAAGLATIARVWASGGPPPSGAVLSDVVEVTKP